MLISASYATTTTSGYSSQDPTNFLVLETLDHGWCTVVYSTREKSFRFYDTYSEAHDVEIVNAGKLQEIAGLQAIAIVDKRPVHAADSKA